MKNYVLAIAAFSLARNSCRIQSCVLVMPSTSLMKHSPETVSPDDTIKDAAEVFAKREFHALPVVEDDKLVGIITTTDIINYFIAQF